MEKYMKYIEKYKNLNIKYLDNPICNFIPLFDIDYNKKKNIVSSSFFKIPKKGNYKNFSIYIDGLQRLNESVKLYMKGFIIRLFIEKSIFNDNKIMNIINKLDNVELVLVECNDYLSNEKNKHRGLFGSLFRFFPMFNFKNNDANFITVEDIDISKLELKFGKNFKKKITFINLIKQKKLKLELFIYGLIGYDNTKNFNEFRHNFMIPYFWASNFISNQRINSNVLVNFIKDENNNKLISYYHGKKTTKCKNLNKKYIYGIDEVFLNKYLIDYLIYNKKSLGIFLNSGIINYFYQNMFYFKNNKNSNNFYKIFIMNFFDFLNVKYNKNENVYKLKKKFSEITWIKNENEPLTNIQIKVYSYIYLYLIKNYYNDNIMKYFNKKLIYYIFSNNHIFGSILYEKIQLINTNYKKKEILLKEIKLPQKIIKYLLQIKNNNINM